MGSTMEMQYNGCFVGSECEYSVHLHVACIACIDLSYQYDGTVVNDSAVGLEWDLAGFSDKRIFVKFNTVHMYASKPKSASILCGWMEETYYLKVRGNLKGVGNTWISASGPRT